MTREGSIDAAVLGKAIALVRLLRGEKQRAAAARLGVSRATVGCIERGSRRTGLQLLAEGRVGLPPTELLLLYRVLLRHRLAAEERARLGRALVALLEGRHDS